MDNYFAGQALAEDERQRGTWRFIWRLATVAFLGALIAALAWGTSFLFTGLILAALCGAVIGEAYLLAEERWVLAAAAYELLSRQIGPMPTLAQARSLGSVRNHIGWILLVMVLLGLGLPIVLFALAFHSFTYSWPLAAVLATGCWLLGLFHHRAHWTLWIGFAAVAIWSLGVHLPVGQFGQNGPAYYLNNPGNIEPQTRTAIGFLSLILAMISVIPIFIPNWKVQALGWITFTISCVLLWGFNDWSQSASGGLLAVIPAPAALFGIVAFAYLYFRGRAKR
jgi:hypothetical protein